MNESLVGSVVLLCAILILARVSGQQHRYPRVVHPRVIPHSELSRDRRSVPYADDRNLQFVSLNDWILKTEPNRQMKFSSKFRVEFDGPASALPPTDELGGCETREGEIRGWEESSQVLLTRCGGTFYGLLRLANRTYLVEPLGLDGRSGEHLLYEAEYSRSRRDAATVYEGGRRYCNLSGDTFDYENYEDNPELLVEPRGDIEARGQGLTTTPETSADPDAVEYFFDRNWQREKLPTRKIVNKFSPPKWLEMAVIADYSVVNFHGSRVQQYILALLNIVSAIYKDSSLDSNMQLVVVRMILYTDKKDGMVKNDDIDEHSYGLFKHNADVSMLLDSFIIRASIVQQGNARRSLENVNKWNRKLLSLSNETYDVAVWLTRLDIGGPSGYAPVSGACDPARSCALNRDEGLTSAFIIAHEVAHILGLSHDGDKNSGNTCAREASRGSIMAPMVAATFNNFHWSTCSRKEFHRKAKHWTCLSNRPADEEPPTVRGSLNEVFSMDEQCRMEFGEGHSRCRTLDSSNLCAYLWCGRTNSTQACKTKKGPPLEGTLCAENKWCVNGLCEPIDRKAFDPTPLAVRGNSENTWGAWSSWSDCSRTCGVGLQYRHRRCNGPNCEGEPKEFRLCDLPACGESVDLRARQCARFFGQAGFRRSLFDGNGTWLPYESYDGGPNCQLVCLRKESAETVHTGVDVEDGTPCSYESSDICVAGKCRPMGCDGVLGSGSSWDACGHCAGNNSTCESVSVKFQRKLRRETTRLAVVPKYAHNVKVVVTILLADSVPHEGNMKILVRDAQRRRYEISKFDMDGRAPVMVIEGAAFRTERLEEKYVLWSKGPVMSEIVVSLVSTREVVKSGASISTSSQYAISRGELGRTWARYSWLLATGGPCSASCGGGVRRRTLLCRDESTRELVSRRKCLLLPKPPGHRELERCNVASCGYTWVPGVWEQCTSRVACAATGKQQRRLYCLPSTFNERQMNRRNEHRIYRKAVQPAKCRDLARPTTERECSIEPTCNGHWLYDEWSPCSQSCGRGVQTRRARCMEEPSRDSSDDDPRRFKANACNATRAANETRVCQGLQCPGAPRCRRDKGPLCALRDPDTHCRNAAFRRRCCLACRGK